MCFLRKESTRVSVVIAELKACGSSKNLQRGRSIHNAVIHSGDDSNVYIASTLISMYAKCGSLTDAYQVFQSMNSRTVASWNALITGYANNGEAYAALNLLLRMRFEECSPDGRTIVAALKACTYLGAFEKTPFSTKRCHAVHLLASFTGNDSDLYVESSLVDMYGKSGVVRDAQRTFDMIKCPQLVSWNALIYAYADNGEGETSLALLSRMGSERVCTPDARTFVAALKACTDLAAREKPGAKDWGRALHLLALRVDSDIFVENTLVDMYANFGCIKDSRRVFDGLKHPNVVSWTAIIMGYAEGGEGEIALSIFNKMVGEGFSPNTRTFVASIKACLDLVEKEDANAIARGRTVHLLACRDGFDLDKYVGNTLVDMYAKFGIMDCANDVFEWMEYRDVVSWTGLINGHADNGEGEVALRLFQRMGRERCEANSTTFVAVLKACAIVGALELGKRFHIEVQTRGFAKDVMVATTLVDFYAKCGSLRDAEIVFDTHPTKDLVTWTALMAGYSRLGDTKGMLAVFHRMEAGGLRPNSVIFKCVLTACSHSGLIDQGKEYFESMCKTYGIQPDIDHYNCMVDLLGRRNKLEEAMQFLRSMDRAATPNVVTWMTLLGACKKWKNLELGKLIFECLTSLDGSNVAAYVLMANIFGAKGMYEEQARLQNMRKNMGFWKKPGRSWWSNRAGEVYTFLAGHKNYPQSREIQEKLENLVGTMRKHGYVADLSSVIGDYSDAEKEDALCGHSEKLAIACALINTKPGETIRIMKNLRICDDCHTASSLISKIEHRTIVCRDASRFHIFKDGTCSCSGFW